MARGHGKNLVFKVDDIGGTLRDMSADVTGVSGLPGSRNLSDTTAAGQEADTAQPGISSATITVTGWLDTRATTGSYVLLSALINATVPSAYEFGPMGDTNGLPKDSGECWLQSFTCDVSIRDTVPFSATFTRNGPNTAGVWP